MFRHHQPERWQILDLAPFDHLTCHLVQRALAGATPGWTMPHRHIRSGNLSQRVSRMIGLSSWLALGPLPLATRTTTQPITGGWFTALLALFRQAQEQVLHLCL